jgi:alanine dehydrogenase
MTIGTPKEQKTDEFRVGLTPENVASLVEDGHSVVVQSGAGEGSGFADSDYEKAGGTIVSTIKELYASAKLIVKVKEPQPSEYDYLNVTHTLFCYLHLAPIPKLVSALVENGVCAIAYETVAVGTDLPLLKPTSEIAGRMAPMVGAQYLSRYDGGAGILISGADGVEPANVLVIGAGNAGFNAAKIAYGMGANVTVLNRSTPKLKKLLEILPSAKTAIYSEQKLREELIDADIVISTVLIHGGATTPKLITREMLKTMKNGSILVDVTIDQGGISEASRPTTHTDATFVQEGVLHYCVANMPGAYPKTATQALCNATFPYVRKLANEGTLDALKTSPSLSLGVNVYKGEVTNKAVAEVLGLEFRELEELI